MIYFLQNQFSGMTENFFYDLARTVLHGLPGIGFHHLKKLFGNCWGQGIFDEFSIQCVFLHSAVCGLHENFVLVYDRIFKITG